MRFFDSFVADFLTSLVKVIVDLARGIYDFFDANAKLPLWIVAILSALPLWFRFQQCLKRYYETDKRFPNLWNALKYALSHSVVILGT